MATILIVDDHGVSRQVLVTLLGYYGHHLLEARDGQEALDQLRTEHADLIISDILMPTMDGYEFVRRLRADSTLAQIPVIFCTATYHLYEARSVAQACGVSLILAKPAEPEEILAAVNGVLGLAPPSADFPSLPLLGSHELSQSTGDKLTSYLADLLQELERRLSTLIDSGSRETADADFLLQAFNQLRDSFAPLQMLSLRVTALVEAGLELALQRDPQDLFAVFCRTAHEIIGGKYATVGVLDENQQTLRYFLTRGVDRETHLQIDSLLPTMGVFGQLLSERRPIRLSNFQGNPQRAGLPASHPPIESFLGVPIASPTRVYGWCYLANKLGAEEFSQHDEQIVLTLTAQAVLAYENIKLNEITEGQAAKLRLEIIERQRIEEELRMRGKEIQVMSQQLWQAAKLATMGELAASIAHELNNPLATISLRAEALLLQTSPEDPQHRALEIIEQEAERMGGLVANLLQFSRRSTQHISTLDIREEIVKSLELLHYHLRDRNITVVHDNPETVKPVYADRQQLWQVFLNLFTNASDAMPHGGALTIQVHEVEQQVVVEVGDTGVGIHPKDLPKVMDPFFTTKPEGKGTGLGLAICRRILQEHHGTLDIFSAGPGRGTTVRLTFPSKNGANAESL